jgi:hypothetical protein
VCGRWRCTRRQSATRSTAASYPASRSTGSRRCAIR